MAEHGIHQGGLAMVNVSDNGYISDSFLHGVLLLIWCSLNAKEKDGQSARLFKMTSCQFWRHLSREIRLIMRQSRAEVSWWALSGINIRLF
jgi:hypothetical protein